MPRCMELYPEKAPLCPRPHQSSRPPQIPFRAFRLIEPQPKRRGAACQAPECLHSPPPFPFAPSRGCFRGLCKERAAQRACQRRLRKGRAGRGPGDMAGAERDLPQRLARLQAQAPLKAAQLPFPAGARSRVKGSQAEKWASKWSSWGCSLDFFPLMGYEESWWGPRRGGLHRDVIEVSFSRWGSNQPCNQPRS